jgi:hypothetical protein
MYCWHVYLYITKKEYIRLRMKKLIFITGPPGSKWSRFSQEMRKSDTIDNSDCNEARSYKHNQYSGHVGVYFGPEMEYGDWLRDGFYPDRLGKEIESIWSGDGQKILMSHNWCYYFNDIIYSYPTATIITVQRKNDKCFEWWQQAGGWNITYPSYTWYKNDNRMKEEISKQNECIEEYIVKNKLQRTYFEDITSTINTSGS